MQLEEQLEAIQNPDANADDADENADDNEDADDNSTSGNTSTSTGAGKEYTVKEGDTMWTIAQSQMSNGADYQKILDANGLKENDYLKPGTKIKIPAAN
jgi:nucleoid-associated protein YgaU